MRILAVIFVAVLLGACWQQGESDPVFEARTALVYDGDSFLVKRGRNEIEIRLYGIDAPEKDQPWSEQSRKALAALIDGKMLRIEPVEWDRYERLVARVYLVGEELYINARMVRDGHAWVFRRYTDERELIRRERQARNEPVGLWRLPEEERVAPWEWRKESD